MADMKEKLATLKACGLWGTKRHNEVEAELGKKPKPFLTLLEKAWGKYTAAICPLQENMDVALAAFKRQQAATVDQPQKKKRKGTIESILKKLTALNARNPDGTIKDTVLVIGGRNNGKQSNIGAVKDVLRQMQKFLGMEVTTSGAAATVVTKVHTLEGEMLNNWIAQYEVVVSKLPPSSQKDSKILALLADAKAALATNEPYDVAPLAALVMQAQISATAKPPKKKSRLIGCTKCNALGRAPLVHERCVECSHMSLKHDMAVVNAKLSELGTGELDEELKRRLEPTLERMHALYSEINDAYLTLTTNEELTSTDASLMRRKAAEDIIKMFTVSADVLRSLDHIAVNSDAIAEELAISNEDDSNEVNGVLPMECDGDDEEDYHAENDEDEPQDILEYQDQDDQDDDDGYNGYFRRVATAFAFGIDNVQFSKELSRLVIANEHEQVNDLIDTFIDDIDPEDPEDNPLEEEEDIPEEEEEEEEEEDNTGRWIVFLRPKNSIQPMGVDTVAQEREFDTLEEAQAVAAKISANENMSSKYDIKIEQKQK